MKLPQAKKLQKGDIVFFNDPVDQEGGEPVSRWYKIETIEIRGLDEEDFEEYEIEEIIITEKDGSVLECYIWELQTVENLKELIDFLKPIRRKWRAAVTRYNKKPTKEKLDKTYWYWNLYQSTLAIIPTFFPPYGNSYAVLEASKFFSEGD